VPITTNVGSLNPAQAIVDSIQHYVIKFVSDVRQIIDFLRILWFLHNKTDYHDVTEI
jgi:hypothetical protein